MTEFSRGFWAWATDHWFLGFILALTIITGATSVLKALLRIFQRPHPKITVNVTAPANNAGQLAQTVAEAVRQVRVETPAPVRRRSVWDRIRDDDD